MKNLLFACAVLGILAVPIGNAQAQEKYHPDHEVIETAARRAAEYMQGWRGLPNAENYKGEMVLAALTVLEVSKRYDAEIPRNNPLVQQAVDTILETLSFERGSNSLNETHSKYYPALALILLCEVDDVTYAPQIQQIIRYFETTQNTNGGWCYHEQLNKGDVSQSQYACLGLFIAKHHGFRINPQVGKRALEFFTAVQNSEGTWHYHYIGDDENSAAPINRRTSNSLHTSGLGSVYLLADLLQLTPRAKNMAGNKNFAKGLPPSVSIYVKPKPGEEESQKKDGPLVNMDVGKVTSTKSQGNRWLADRFTVNSNDWNYYYLYALERYAFFREQSEGSVKEVPNWYDQGCDFLLALQQDDGRIVGSDQSPMNAFQSTALATLFLVRSSEILIQPSNATTMQGGIGFQENAKYKMERGQLKSEETVQGVEDVMTLLDNDELEAEQLQLIADSIGNSIDNSNSSLSKSARIRFLTGLIKERDYFRRLVAVKMLAREQTMDNVPMLLYALSDPNLGIAAEAHNGLRLISRKVDAFPISEDPDKAEFKILQKKWTEWFLKIRPDAKLIEED